MASQSNPGTSQSAKISRRALPNVFTGRSIARRTSTSARAPLPPPPHAPSYFDRRFPLARRILSSPVFRPLPGVSGEPRSVSKLQRYRPKAASKNAPAEAEKTEKSSGAFTPSENVIASAKSNSKIPLNSAAARVKHPNTSVRPNTVSTPDAAHAKAGTKAVGKNQSNVPV